jgi:hypothetical protein
VKERRDRQRARGCAKLHGRGVSRGTG